MKFYSAHLDKLRLFAHANNETVNVVRQKLDSFVEAGVFRRNKQKSNPKKSQRGYWIFSTANENTSLASLVVKILYQRVDDLRPTIIMEFNPDNIYLKHIFNIVKVIFDLIPRRESLLKFSSFDFAVNCEVKIGDSCITKLRYWEHKTEYVGETAYFSPKSKRFMSRILAYNKSAHNIHMSFSCKDYKPSRPVCLLKRIEIRKPLKPAVSIEELYHIFTNQPDELETLFNVYLRQLENLLVVSRREFERYISTLNLYQAHILLSRIENTGISDFGVALSSVIDSAKVDKDDDGNIRKNSKQLLSICSKMKKETYFYRFVIPMARDDGLESFKTTLRHLFYLTQVLETKNDY